MPLALADQPSSSQKLATFDPGAFLASTGLGRARRPYKRGTAIFRQGDAAVAVYYIHKGRVNLTVTSKHGKQGVIAILEQGAFFGEECLAGHPLCTATASALEEATIIGIDRNRMISILREHPEFSHAFIGHLLSRNVEIESDLVDHLFNTSERRLARVLLLLAHFGKDGKKEQVIPKISQDVLAARVGTTRSRVNHFMNKFRQLGYIDYTDTIKVNSALLEVVVHGDLPWLDDPSKPAEDSPRDS
jgi:CRP-like cAMP-binding protein